MPTSYRFLLMLFLASYFFQASAQAPIQSDIKKPVNAPDGNPTFIQFSKQDKKIRLQDAGKLLEQRLGLAKQDKLALIKSDIDTPNSSAFHHQTYQQYHEGLKVEYGIYKVHARNGLIESASGEYYTVPTLSPLPTYSEEKALSQALRFVGANKYKWQLVGGKGSEARPPKAELVFCKDFFTYHQKGTTRLALAYKFDIYAHEPLSRAYIYVDAHSGQIIHQNAIIKHVDGTASTRYSGSQSIATQQLGGTYVLRDATRGNGIETYNLQQDIFYTNAIDFEDNDNNWTAIEHDNSSKDNAALDAHWGATKTYDYFKTQHSRNSFDGNGAKIRSYVHYDVEMENAFWDGSLMFYGDGETDFDALTSLDIVAHELAHAVCQYTADLVYSHESGAINEGLSDIWGASVEYSAAPNKSTWLIGEDAGANHVPIRSLINPNAYEQPDTYQGNFWYAGEEDHGGVHTNSGVINHWFYLLSVGKSGTNDHGYAYNVTGIGIEKAARIVYRTESVYMSANSQYTDARAFSIHAATDLFGANSKEAIQTANAWNAVGLYAYLAVPTHLQATANSATQVSLQWQDQSTTETGFRIERSTKPNSDFALVAEVNANATTYVDKGLATDKVYFYRVLALKGKERSMYSNTANVSLGNAPIVMTDANFTTCKAVFLDPGGATSYSGDEAFTTTFSPATPGAKIQVAFSSFSTFPTYDVLSIYDGATSSARLIGRYSGSQLPPTATATNAMGQLTFTFSSWIGGTGWQATVSCLTLPLAPSTLTAAALSSSEIILTWKDNATNEAAFEIYRSATTANGFSKVGEVASNLLTYTDKNLLASTKYYYKVLAKNAVGNSALSNEANATTSAKLSNAPATLVATGQQNQIKLTWTDNSNDEQKFEIHRSATATNGFAKIAEVTANTATYTNVGLPAATKYYYKVRAVNANGSSAFSNEASATTTSAVPAVPGSLSATTASKTQINLKWVDNSNSEQKFEIYQANASNGTFNKIGDAAVNATSFAVNNLSPGTTYYYKIKAVNAAGASGFSNEANATTVANPPTAPSTLVATAATQLRVNLSWKDHATNEQKFEIFRSLTPGNGFVKIGETAANTIVYTDQNLLANTKYYYRIQAVNTGGASAFSNEAAVTTLPAPPSAPYELRISLVAQSQLTLVWKDNSTNEQSFEVHRSLTSTSGFVKIADVPANTTTYVNTGLAVNSKYFYKIRAINTGGASDFSNETSATTLPPAPSPPINLTATVLSQTQVNLNWQDKATNEDRYEIHRSVKAGSDFTKLADVAANSTAYSDKSALAATTYYYQVRAVNAGGFSGTSNEVKATTLPAIPSTPTTLAATAISQTQITLTWKDNSTNEQKFEVHRSVTAGSGFVKIADVAANTTTFANTGLVVNSTYFYKVLAVNNGVNSAFSNEVSATTFPTIPTMPTTLSIVSFAQTQINLTWQDKSDNEMGFKIERSATNAGGFTEIAQVGANVTAYSSKELNTSTKYVYRVRAYNLGGNSAYSNEAAATTLPPIPLAPSQLSAVLQSVFTAQITWKDNADNEVKFIIERSANANNGFAVIDTVAANAKSYTDVHIQVGTGYFYRVRAINSGGSSAYSNVSGLALITALEDDLLAKGTIIYPNPSPDGHFVIRLDPTLSGRIQTQVINPKGQCIEECVYTKYTGEFTFFLDLSEQAAGEYLLRIITPKGKAVKRLIKE